MVCNACSLIQIFVVSFLRSKSVLVTVKNAMHLSLETEKDFVVKVMMAWSFQKHLAPATVTATLQYYYILGKQFSFRNVLSIN